MQEGPRQLEHAWVTELRQPSKSRSSGVSQPKELGRLVEGLPRCVVNGLTQQFVPAHIIDAHELGMSAGHEKCNEGELRWVDTEER